MQQDSRAWQIAAGWTALASLIDPSGEPLADVAQMHRTELPDSLISRLGQAYTGAFYKFAAWSDFEFVFARTDDRGGILGGGFVSLSPADLTRRMAMDTPLFRTLVVRPSLATSLMWQAIQSTGRTQNANPQNDPELVALFVRRDLRSRGIGALLVRDIEQVLRDQNRKRYLIRTMDRTENRGVNFYESVGFVTVSSVSMHGERFRVMAKEF